MSDPNERPPREPATPTDRLGAAYDRMLERVQDEQERLSHDTLPRLQERIAVAKEKAVELGELTREEAERVGEYLRRDLTDAAEYLSETGRELKDWLRFDLALIEQRLLNLFSIMVDRTRLELDRLARAAREADYLHTGELTAMGTLACADCGQELHIRGPGPVPPCPRCHGTRFTRASAQ